MAGMAETDGPSRNAWLPAFTLSILAFAASLIGLLFVIGDAVGDEEVTPPPRSDATPTPLPRLTYSGQPPPGVDLRELDPAAAGVTADVVFAEGTAQDGFAYRYFVPVASLGAGVDTLTHEQVAAIASGALTWQDAGGIGQTALLAGARSDVAALTRFTGSEPQQAFGSYDELYAAMADPLSGIFALVPLEQVRFQATAIEVDGIDIVRGKGNPADWPFIEWLSVRGTTERGRQLADRLQTELRAEVPQSTTVVATGDILMSRCSLTAIEATGDWGAALRGEMGDYLAAADLTLGSLDGSIQDINPPFRCVAGTNLSSPPEVMEALTLAGFDIITVATNHIFDCGIEYCGDRAFLQTLTRLHEAGIKTVGGGVNLEEALAPAIVEVNGVRFGVLGFDDVAAMDFEATAGAPGTAPLDDSYEEERLAGEPAFFRPAAELSTERFTERIRALKAQVDVVILQVQTGTEDTHDPSPRSIKALRAAAEAGADLIVGNQAHHVQAIEAHGGSFISYALGNFIFDQRHTVEHEQGYVLEATFWGPKLVNVKMLPYRIIDQHRPTFVTGAERSKILGDVFGADISPETP